MSRPASQLGAKAQIDFHCFSPECDGVVKFNLADIAGRDFQAVCPDITVTFWLCTDYRDATDYSMTHKPTQTTATVGITSPVRSGIAAVADWADGVSTYVFHYGEIQDQIQQLEQENADLRKQIRDGEAASQENQQLLERLNLQAKREDFVLESAKVTARATSNWQSTLTLSKGTAHGVEVGDCAITEEGYLVGIITAAGTNWSTLLTVVDTDSAIGARVFRTEDDAVAHGDFALMGEGRRPLPRTRCLEEKNDEVPDVAAQRAARRSRPGPELGHHGDRRIQHLPHP